MIETKNKPSLLQRVIAPEPGIRSAGNAVLRLRRVLFLWQKGAHAGQLGEISPAMIEVANPENRLRLASILLEAGHFSDAVELAAETYAGTPGLLHRLRFPALTLAISLLRPEVTAEISAEVAVLDQFSRQGDKFRSLVETHAGSIAIVGNSPVLLEREDGDEIDDHAMVIRFNNFQLPPAQRRSTGARSTVWFRTLSFDWLWRRDRNGFDLSILPGQAAFYRKENGQDLLLDHALREQDCDFVPHAIYHALRLDHGIMAPSLGLLCLSWVNQILGGLDRADIYGFRMLDQPDFGTQHYFSHWQSGPKHPHSWATEYEALSAMSPIRFPSQKVRAEPEMLPA